MQVLNRATATRILNSCGSLGGFVAFFWQTWRLHSGSCSNAVPPPVQPSNILEICSWMKHASHI